MSILEAAATTLAIDEEDGAAIAALAVAFERQRAAFATERMPTLAARRERLEALVGMMLANRQRISAAISDDFGAHPVPASDLIEVLGVVGRAQYVLAHLEEWTKPDPREVGAAMGTAHAYVSHQPKGVIGNIVPWNFPFDLSVGPLT